MKLNLNSTYAFFAHFPPGIDRFKNFQSLFPPRDVKDFRVVITRDAHTDRKSANRTAQITVWNVMSLIHEEGGRRGDFKVGQTFLVRRIGTQSLKAMLSDSLSGHELVPQSARVLDGSFQQWRWDSVPCDRKTHPLDLVSTVTMSLPLNIHLWFALCYANCTILNTGSSLLL